MDRAQEDLDALRGVLPPGTARSWQTIAPAVPGNAYLAGGTALAVHLRHRVSRDLDFFVESSFDVEALAEKLASLGPFAPTLATEGTLNGVFEATKVQFLEASSQHNLMEPERFAGVRVASIPDLLATKLKVIADRAELRDYFDIMTIEQKAGLSVEEGLRLFVDRYRPIAPAAAVGSIVRGLGYLDDVADDPGLPVDGAVVRAFWRGRVARLAW